MGGGRARAKIERGGGREREREREIFIAKLPSHRLTMGPTVLTSV